MDTLMPAIDARERFADFKRGLREALLVYARMPDVDAKFRAGLRGKWGFSVVYERSEHGERYDSPWLKHVASPMEITEMEQAMEWLAWLRRQPKEGDAAVRRIIGWATGTPMTTLAWREHRCERTIKGRIDRSIALIFKELLSVIVVVEEVEDEPVEARITHFGERASRSGSPDSLEPGKIWIADSGPQGGYFMVNGERYDPEGAAVARMAARRRRRGK
jgi:hypothetical protein